MYVNPAVKAIRSSGIREVLDLLQNRDDVIRLMVGDPDFPTPDNIIEAGVKAAHSGYTHYTQSAGIWELREAAAAKLRTGNGIPATAANVVICQGATQGLFSIVKTITEPGDNVLIPDPGWPNFKIGCEALGVETRPYVLDALEGSEPDFEHMARLVDDRTRLVLCNSPSNPLGTMFSERVMVEFVLFARRHDLWLISDECYDELVYDGRHVSPASLGDAPNVISVYSLSKTYAMSGWRIGYLSLPDPLVGPFLKVQEGVVSCMNTPAQYASLEALTGPQECVANMRSEYRRRRDLACELLAEAGVRTQPPAGAIYLWLAVREGISSHEAALRLANLGVGVAPGDTFGHSGDHAIRISLSVPEGELREGLGRVCSSGVLSVEP